MAESAAQKLLADDEGCPLLVLLNLMASPIFCMCRLLTTPVNDTTLTYTTSFACILRNAMDRVLGVMPFDMTLVLALVSTVCL